VCAGGVEGPARVGGRVMGDPLLMEARSASSEA